ncbi:MAG: RidA family protein [Myxococcales bacterium]|nr:RidA family protein [Myxococcales bacterium]
MSSHDIIQPPSFGAPKGYSHGVLAAPGRTLFIAGQIAWDEDQKIVSVDFVEQFERALTNVVTVIEAAGGLASDLCRLTIYVVDRREYLEKLAEVGMAYRRAVGRHFPAMALVEVSKLLEPGAKVEIEGTAVIPTVRT